ncbi:MAG TPA: DNA repair protein RecO [Flavobacteriaceae bacterium]|nr:DNA repair protein RecO [Flavobacteriaceae bacterium]HEX5742934.1 DNA repair protein RecO [Flavobacteriaceae bacterium]
MIVSTKAIVIHTFKFGDTSLIVKLYTQTDGIKSYLIKGAFSHKSKFKAAYFQPLNLLDIEASHNNRGTLNSLKEVRVHYHYQTIPTNIVKQTILIFLAEILNSSLVEAENQETLFEYLITALTWLDTHDKTSNFHLLFLLNLSKYLGFYPETKMNGANFFDLSEGKFSNNLTIGEVINNDDLKLFKSLLGTNFDSIEQLKLNSQIRQQLLNILIHYYEIHISGFKKPKSLPILKSIFE